MALVLVFLLAVGQVLPPGHPPMGAGEQGNAPSAEELLKRLDSTANLEGQEKTFEVASALGKLYAAHGRHSDAVIYWGQAVLKAEPARALYLEQRRKTKAAKKTIPSGGDVGCAPSAESTVESLVTLARAKAKAGDAPAAAACARVALHALAEVDAQLALALLVLRRPDEALRVYERELELFESNPDALFGRATVLLDTRGDDVTSLKRARADYQKLLEDYPTSPRAVQAKAYSAHVDRAIAAGGVTKLAALPPPPPPTPEPSLKDIHSPPALTQEMVDAVQNTERTPELESGLTKLMDEGEEHLARGRFQEALDVYKRVVPFMPNSGRAKAGMAWSLVKLDRQPMADRVWSVAVSSDAAAVRALSDTLRAKGDPSGAEAVQEKLKRSN